MKNSWIPLPSWQNSDQRRKNDKDKCESYRVEIAIFFLFVNFSCRDFVRADDIEMLEELQRNSKLKRNSKAIWFFQIFGPDSFSYTIISTYVFSWCYFWLGVTVGWAKVGDITYLRLSHINALCVNLSDVSLAKFHNFFKFSLYHPH